MITRHLWVGQYVKYKGEIRIVIDNAPENKNEIQLDKGDIAARAELEGLSERENKIMYILGTLAMPEALNGYNEQDRKKLIEDLKELA